MVVPRFDNLDPVLQLALDPLLCGSRITPYMMFVRPGEDITKKIVSFAEQEAPGVCVLSATGSVSRVTVRQPGPSGIIERYEGQFDIVSLSGSFIPLNDDVSGTRYGAVNVFLVGPEGRVLGGIVAGLLLAATPVQVLLGRFSFDQDHQEGYDDEGKFDENEVEGEDAVASKLEPKINMDKGEDKDKNAGTSKLEPKLEPKMDVDEDEGEASVTSKFKPNLEFSG